jgi:helix-turn-helix protein
MTVADRPTSTAKALNLDDVVSRLRHALTAVPADSVAVQDLNEVLNALGDEPIVRVGTAARLLGVSSPDTVKNWARAGRFPGAQKTDGGQWQFPLAEVLAHRANQLLVEDRRRRRDYSTPRFDGDPYEELGL